MLRHVLTGLMLCTTMSAQVIQWARQFGTTGTVQANAVAVTQGAVYVAGDSSSGSFPGQTNAGSSDAFVTRFDLEGNLVWSRQFGTSAAEYALGVAADTSGVYVVGYTSGGLQGANAGGEDAFVRKYDPNGNVLWTRQFGGSGQDQATSVAVDAAGLYVGGWASTALPGQTLAGGVDAFLRRYDFNGNEVWTRQFGSVNNDKIYGVAVDAGAIYVGGDTNGALGTAVGSTDNFVRKYDANGNALWTRQFGTSGNDGGFYNDGIAVNSSGVYVISQTTGTIPGQSRVGGLWDAYLQKIDLNGNLQWARQIGSTGEDSGYGIAVGPQWVYAVGQEGSGTVLWRFDFNGNALGKINRGVGADTAYGAASDGGGVYVAGFTFGSNFGLTGIGGRDAFVYKVPHPPIISGIADAFTGQIGVAPTTWTALYGTNLSPITRTWDGAISGTQLPTALDEVRASVNGRPATVYFVSPGQVNVLAPLDDATGNVQVTLTNRYGTSPALEVRKSNYLPAFYAPFGEASGLRVTAVALDGTLVGKVGLDPRVARAARPGEIVQIFATGFGPTNPATPSDTIFSVPPAVANPPRISIGGREASFIGSGNLVGPGLYQFNVTIPDLADGDHPIIAEAGGIRSSSTVFISVRR